MLVVAPFRAPNLLMFAAGGGGGTGGWLVDRRGGRPFVVGIRQSRSVRNAAVCEHSSCCSWIDSAMALSSCC